MKIDYNAQTAGNLSKFTTKKNSLTICLKNCLISFKHTPLICVILDFRTFSIVEKRTSFQLTKGFGMTLFRNPFAISSEF